MRRGNAKQKKGNGRDYFVIPCAAAGVLARKKEENFFLFCFHNHLLNKFKMFLKTKKGTPTMVINNTKIYIILALIVAVPLAIVVKNAVTKFIEKRKDEI